MFSAVEAYFVARFGGEQNGHVENQNFQGSQNVTSGNAQISTGKSRSAPKIRAADVVLLRLLTDLA